MSGMSDEVAEKPEATIAGRVRKGFEDASPSDVQEYLDRLQTSWREAEGFNRRNMTLALVAVVIFELATRNAVSEVSLLTVKISAIPLLKFVLPVFVSYLYMSNIIHVTHIELLDDIYCAVYELKLPGQYRQDLEIPLEPVGMRSEAGRFSSPEDRKKACIIGVATFMTPYFLLPLLVAYMGIRFFWTTPTRRMRACGSHASRRRS